MVVPSQVPEPVQVGSPAQVLPVLHVTVPSQVSLPSHVVLPWQDGFPVHVAVLSHVAEPSHVTSGITSALAATARDSTCSARRAVMTRTSTPKNFAFVDSSESR